MVKILNKPIYDRFISLVSNSNESIKLCAPFIKLPIVDDIYKNKKDKVKLDIITNINLMSFVKKSSDISAIKEFISNNDSVFNSNILHAKFYIFDNSQLIITSANLTSSGLKRNLEYGVITNDASLIGNSINDFLNICKLDTVGKIRCGHVEKISNILNSIPPPPKETLPKLILEYNQNDEIFDKDIVIIINNLNGWQKTVFNELNRLKKVKFSTSDFDVMIPSLKRTYPNNHNIDAKIRQMLQQLRDIGLVKFEGNGVYHKLWK